MQHFFMHIWNQRIRISLKICFYFILFYMPFLASIIEYCATVTSNPTLYAIEITAGALTYLGTYVRGPARRHPARFDNMSHDFACYLLMPLIIVTWLLNVWRNYYKALHYAFFHFSLISSRLSSQTEISLRDEDRVKISCGSVEIGHTR
jgi:hypothetical protein